MSLSAENELTVRRAIADKLALAAEIGFVIPAPLYFNDKADFWATLSEKTTRADIEKSLVKFCAVYPLQFEDVQTVTVSDEPLINLTYEFYLFHERNSERADETGAPDAFNRQLLKSHSDFIAAWLNARGEFLGKQYLTALDETVFVVRQTNSLSQIGFISNDAECEFVRGAKGFEVRMQLRAKIQMKDC